MTPLGVKTWDQSIWLRAHHEIGKLRVDKQLSLYRDAKKKQQNWSKIRWEIKRWWWKNNPIQIFHFPNPYARTNLYKVFTPSDLKHSIYLSISLPQQLFSHRSYEEVEEHRHLPAKWLAKQGGNWRKTMLNLSPFFSGRKKINGKIETRQKMIDISLGARVKSVTTWHVIVVISAPKIDFCTKK